MRNKLLSKPLIQAAESHQELDRRIQAREESQAASGRMQSEAQ